MSKNVRSTVQRCDDNNFRHNGQYRRPKDDSYRRNRVRVDEEYMRREERIDDQPVDESFDEVSNAGLKATCVQVYGKDCKGNLQLSKPTGVAQLLDGSVIVCDTFNNRLVKYTANGTLEKIFNAHPPLNKPSAVVLVPDTPADPAAFAVKDHSDIVVFDASGEQLRSLTNQGLARPYGLTLDEDHSVLITIETGRRGGNTITKLDPVSGSATQVTLHIENENGAGSQVSKPRFIAHLKNEVLVIVDLGLDTIVMVSTETGGMLRRFGRPGTGPAEFRDPSGVVCDADGLIVVGDSRNHRLQVFSPEGKFLALLAVDRPLKRPSGLYLTPCSHLLVINYWENTIAKYKIEQA